MPQVDLPEEAEPAAAAPVTPATAGDADSGDEGDGNAAMEGAEVTEVRGPLQASWVPARSGLSRFNPALKLCQLDRHVMCSKYGHRRTS